MARNVSYDKCVEGAAVIADNTPGGVTIHMDNLEFVVVFESLQAQKQNDPQLAKVIDGLRFTFHRVEGE
jgi:hypothetical protein